jgi:hypothetical protein
MIRMLKKSSLMKATWFTVGFAVALLCFASLSLAITTPAAQSLLQSDCPSVAYYTVQHSCTFAIDVAGEERGLITGGLSSDNTMRTEGGAHSIDMPASSFQFERALV